MTSESVKPLTYPSGLWGWPEMLEGCIVELVEPGPVFRARAFTIQHLDKIIIVHHDHLTISAGKERTSRLSPAEWRVLNQIIEWCWISLQEHQRTGEVEDVTFSHPTDHDVQRTLLMQDCSCGSRWLHDSQEPDLGWIHVTNSLPTEPRRVDVIEAT